MEDKWKTELDPNSLALFFVKIKIYAKGKGSSNATLVQIIQGHMQSGPTSVGHHHVTVEKHILVYVLDILSQKACDVV